MGESKILNIIQKVVLILAEERNILVQVNVGLCHVCRYDACMYIYICVCVCVNIKFKSTYFMSPNISLSTLTQCISSNNMFYNSFLFLTLFNYVFFFIK